MPDFPEGGISGFSPSTVGDHHRGFNAALDDAVSKYAEFQGGPTDALPFSVSFVVFVSVENPGRIEGYAAKLEPA